jgi:hypothetical protein
MSVAILGITVESISQNFNSFQVINNAFGPVDNLNGFFTPISVGGVAKTDFSSISFGLTDFSQTAFSSTALPTTLNVASFSQRRGAIFDDASDGTISFSIDTLGTSPPAIKVKMDIKPGSFPNSINPESQGRIPVAILTTAPSDNVATFDATNVDGATVRFGSTGTEASPVDYSLEDVDADGDLDLRFSVMTSQTGIKCGDTLAILKGETFDGERIEGSDSVKTAGCTSEAYPTP